MTTNTTNSTINLASFAGDVKAAALLVPSHVHVGRKVFASHVWAFGGSHGIGILSELSLDEFKAALAEAHQAGCLTLSRCDLPEAFEARDVKRSKTTIGSSDFHFVRLS